MEKIKGHSNLDVFKKDSCVLSIRGEACYSRFTYCSMDTIYGDSLVVYHDPDVEKKFRYIPEYVNWLLNDEEWLGSAFITKSYEEGIKNGFQMDVTKPVTFMVSAMNQLRYPFEAFVINRGIVNNWSFPYFVDLGFDYRTSIYLARQFSLIGDYVGNNGHNSNHLTMSKDNKLKSYYKEGFMWLDEEQTLKDGYRSVLRRSITGSWQKPGYFGKPLYSMCRVTRVELDNGDDFKLSYPILANQSREYFEQLIEEHNKS